MRFLVAGIVLAPIAAALTNNGTPHALRSSGMLPFLFLIAALGADGLRRALAGRAWVRGVLTGVLGAGLLAQAIVFTIDLYAAYPSRAAPYFDTGAIAAITTAHDVAGSHRVFLSDTLDQPYIEAFFAYLPPPPSRPETDDATPGLATLGMQVINSGVAESEASAGDVLVLESSDPRPPSTWVLVATENAPANLLDTAATRPALIAVYRFGGQ